MVIIKTGTICQNPVAFHIQIRVRPFAIFSAKSILFLILGQRGHPEPTHIQMRVLLRVSPFAENTFALAGLQQLHRFFDRIRIFQIFPDNSILGFQTQEGNAHIMDLRIVFSVALSDSSGRLTRTTFLDSISKS